MIIVLPSIYLYLILSAGMDNWNLQKLAKVGFGADISDLKGKSLDEYGKRVVVTAEEFERSMNINKKSTNNMKGSSNQQDQLKGSQFLKTFSPEQREKLLECFKKYSTSKTVNRPPRSRLNAYGVREVVYGEPETNVTVSEQELGKLFSDAGIPLHGHTLTNIYNQLAKVKGQGANFNDIMKLLDCPNGSLDKEEDLRQVFKVYDKKDRGYFDFQDYKLVCEGVAKKLGRGQMWHAFKAMDFRGEGKITFEMFARVMRGQH